MTSRPRTGIRLLPLFLVITVSVVGCASPEEIALRQAEAIILTQEASIRQTAESMRLTAEARISNIITTLPAPPATQRSLRFERLPVEVSTWNNGFGANTFAQAHWSAYYTRLGGLHNGLDFGAPAGTFVYAGIYGTLTGTSGDAKEGGHVVVTSGDYLITYGHTMRDKNLVDGQEITPNMLIGAIADDESNDHLHLSVKSGGHYYNPLFFFDDGLIDANDWGPYVSGESPYSMRSFVPQSTDVANYWTDQNVAKLDIQR